LYKEMKSSKMGTLREEVNACVATIQRIYIGKSNQKKKADMLDVVAGISQGPEPDQDKVFGVHMINMLLTALERPATQSKN